MTSTPIFNHSNIQTLLAEDVAACQALLKLLQSEREALKLRDHQALETIIQNKVTHLQRLETSANTRSQWAQQLNADGKTQEEQWQNLIGEQAPKTALLWQDLKGLLDQCKHENEVNGKILARNQKTFTRLMNILRGQTASTNLYNNKGSNNSHLPGQSIGKA